MGNSFYEMVVDGGTDRQAATEMATLKSEHAKMLALLPKLADLVEKFEVDLHNEYGGEQLKDGTYSRYDPDAVATVELARALLKRIEERAKGGS